ncbi:c-type cytochrome [Vogesella oryzae]|uniref:c-type cytochrome n=1 Tax=Vogesella oryzae TaxID=1735285 RepID=UPI0015843BFE|nr:cytochrome c [Vogesella oryzae]
MKLVIVMLGLCCYSALASAGDNSKGKELFQTNCAACHGEHGEGKHGVAPRLAGDASRWSLKLFERAVLSGVDDNGRKLKLMMPHWQNGSFKGDNGNAPSKEEIAAIHQYLKHPR